MYIKITTVCDTATSIITKQATTCIYYYIYSSILLLIFKRDYIFTEHAKQEDMQLHEGCMMMFFIQLHTIIKLYTMQEPIDNDLHEILTREEELMMMENKELIKHILRLEREYYANQKDNEELPW